MDYYTEIYILDNNSKKYVTNYDEYLKQIEETTDLIETIKEDRTNARHKQIIADANKKIR